MKYLLLIISFLMISDCFSQIYELSNKEILLKIGIAKQDDSTIILTRTIINNTDDDIYVTPFSGEHEYDYFGADFFVVQMGGFAPGLYTELSPLLLLLNEKDTMISSQKIHIVLNRIVEMENICICFDYLNPSKQKEKMLLLQCIHEYSKRNNPRLYTIGRKLYGNLCESIRLKMQFSIKNVPLM